MEGWIKVHRKILEWEWFSDTKTFHLFMYLLASASHNDFRFKGRQLKAGQTPFGLQTASNFTGISVRSIRTALDKLKSTNEVTIETGRQGSVITIVNWDKYQGATNELTSKRQRNDNETTTTKNERIKELKNNNNSRTWFDECWNMYPNKQGKKQSERHFSATVKSEQDYLNIKHSIQNYLQCDKVKAGYIKNGETFFNNWKDWVNPTAEMMGQEFVNRAKWEEYKKQSEQQEKEREIEDEKRRVEQSTGAVGVDTWDEVIPF